ncbi:MAG: hypothetical protein JWO38_1119 [Gemmataceae bacterium]|nr:hypothetical protein [Gemmataceae bacterium]
MVRAAAARPSGGPIRTAEEWLGTADVRRMLRCVGGGGWRKAVLFMAACHRGHTPDGGDRHDRKLPAALEEYADGAVEAAGLRRVRWEDPALRAGVEAVTAPGFGPTAAARPALDLCRGDAGELAALAGLVRELYGNPFRPVAVDLAWRSSTVVSLARQMYESRDFSPMPILADALQDAGCDHPDVLAHCRGPGPHVRGCWVADLLLGRK